MQKKSKGQVFFLITSVVIVLLAVLVISSNNKTKDELVFFKELYKSFVLENVINELSRIVSIDPYKAPNRTLNFISFLEKMNGNMGRKLKSFLVIATSNGTERKVNISLVNKLSCNVNGTVSVNTSSSDFYLENNSTLTLSFSINPGDVYLINVISTTCNEYNYSFYMHTLTNKTMVFFLADVRMLEKNMIKRVTDSEEFLFGQL